MKRVIAVVLGVAVALGCVLAYSVWRGETEVLAPIPGRVELERRALQTQLDRSTQREAEIEKVYWDQPEKLQVLIESHQKRMAELEGNPAGSAIVAHDKNAIARLQNRIAAIAAMRQAAAEAAAARAAAEAEAEQNAAANP